MTIDKSLDSVWRLCERFETCPVVERLWENIQGIFNELETLKQSIKEQKIICKYCNDNSLTLKEHIYKIKYVEEDIKNLKDFQSTDRNNNINNNISKNEQDENYKILSNRINDLVKNTLENTNQISNTKDLLDLIDSKVSKTVEDINSEINQK